ncbi:hypothetical protein Mapa_016084 [Marchantia paleacea]|nr:hypothetical protein Mapa_016084 [Marchantia paleacea]
MAKIQSSEEQLKSSRSRLLHVSSWQIARSAEPSHTAYRFAFLLHSESSLEASLPQSVLAQLILFTSHLTKDIVS